MIVVFNYQAVDVPCFNFYTNTDHKTYFQIVFYVPHGEARFKFESEYSMRANFDRIINVFNTLYETKVLRLEDIKSPDELKIISDITKIN